MADAYGTNDGFTAYHTARGRAVQISDLDDAQITAARLVGSEFIDGRYAGAFPGLKVGMRAQVREWPRQGGSDRDGYNITSDTVPTEVENATYEAALRDAVQPGSLQIDWTPNEFKRVSVDGAVSVEYSTFTSPDDAQTQFIVIDRILAPVLTGSGNVSMLSGAISRV